MQKKLCDVKFKSVSDQCEMTNDSGDIFVGIVTALDADFGFIDGTIFFTKPRFIFLILFPISLHFLNQWSSQSVRIKNCPR